MTVGDSIRAAESGGDNYAKNDRSSAYGPDQFLSGTWLDTIKATRPDLAQGKSDAELLALRSDPDLSGQMRDAYAAANNAILAKAGLPVTPGATYLAHFAGPGGAVKVMQADPNTPVASILGSDVMKANPHLQGMTAQGLQAWASKRVGTPMPAPGTPGNQAASAPPQAGPTGSLLPQGPAPIFPPQQAAPQQAQPQAAPAFAQIPDIQAPPIFYAPQRPPNLAGLRAAFKAPIFRKG